jgi:glycosyltransferase involved in cell wall biosynthesis
MSLKITYIHQYFNTLYMHGSTRSFEFARRLVINSHHVNVITSWRDLTKNRRWFCTKEDGIDIHWIPIRYNNSMNFTKRLRSFLLFVWYSSIKASSLPADIVFATSTPLTVALPGAYVAKRLKIPMIFEVRDLWPELPIAVGVLNSPFLRYLAKRLELFAYRESAHIIALSPGIKNGIVASGYPEDKISVIPNAADLDLFNPDKVNRYSFRMSHPEIGSDPLIVYVGTLGNINGVEYLPNISAESIKMGFRLKFAVIGSGQNESNIRKIAANLGVLGQNFFMFPAVPKNQIPQILSAADIALSLFIDIKQMWSNSANKFFDALASGTPVAINYGGWQAELIEETGAGIVLPPNDPVAASISLNDFVCNSEHLVRAGRAARSLAEGRFCRDKLANQFEEILISIVKNYKSI